jgi:hypothetical protein
MKCFLFSPPLNSDGFHATKVEELEVVWKAVRPILSRCKLQARKFIAFVAKVEPFLLNAV